jgi:hypothetical protein
LTTIISQLETTSKKEKSKLKAKEKKEFKHEKFSEEEDDYGSELDDEDESSEADDEGNEARQAQIHNFHNENLDPEETEDQDLENEIQIITNFEIMKTSFHSFDEFTYFQQIFLKLYKQDHRAIDTIVKTLPAKD